jgi:hypothetical protein
VGVVDVLVRTGRDLYSVLHDVADAPEDIERLCDCINDTVVIAEATKQFLAAHTNRTPAGTASTAVD